MNNYYLGFEDSVFENRNKSYGAFAIRAAYASNMTKAMLLAMGSLLTVVSLAAYYSHKGIDTMEKLMGPVLLLDDVKVEKATIKKIELPKPKKPAHVAAAPVLQKTITNTSSITVVDDTKKITEILPPTKDQLINAISSNTTTDGLDKGSGNAIGAIGNTSKGTDLGDNTTAIKPPVVFNYVAEMPSFPNGLNALYKYLNDKLRYPSVARENGIDGTVTLRFVVTETGKIEKIEVVRGIGGGCDEEAIRVVKSMPDWRPGRHQGKAVPVRFTLPIKFTLKN